MGMGPQLDTAAVVAPATIPAAAAGGGGSYAVLQCGEDSAYVRDAYGGYFNVFRALLEEDGERWRVYRAVRGELPSEDEAAGFDGFVISGSCSDAHGDEPWILALVDLIRRAHAAGKRVLGICFGHQVVLDNVVASKRLLCYNISCYQYSDINCHVGARRKLKGKKALL